MYAVIRTGGKQYRVEEGDTVEVEHLGVKGNKVTFVPVLVVTDDGKTVYGRKELKAFSVSAKILGDAKGDKVSVLKYRPKSGYASKTGHRQLYSLIEITSIGERGKSEARPKEGAQAESDVEATEAAPSAGSEAEEPG